MKFKNMQIRRSLTTAAAPLPLEGKIKSYFLLNLFLENSRLN